MQFICLLLSLFLVGCNSSPQGAKPTSTDQTLTIAVSTDLQALDPRMMRDTLSANVAHMLFEGLMYTDYNNHIVPGIAKSVQISDDGLTYTFELKDTFWSDGSPLTANDFEYTWKSTLDPQFPAPNAYQLYVIKGAQAAKEGKAPLSSVGITASDPHTLVVQLEKPTPYFLDLTTTHFFIPVSERWAKSGIKEGIVSNGPFKLGTWKPTEEFTAIKNPHFWNHENVRLTRVSLAVIDDNTALKLFEKGSVDWVGSPMSLIPADATATLKAQGKLIYAPAAVSTWLRVNTGLSPFNHLKIRKAFNLAIDRHALVEYIIKGTHIPATGIVPLTFGIQTRPYFQDNDIPNAWTNFQDALKDMEISKDDLPSISFCYVATDRNHKIAQAIQQQWVNALGIEVRLEPCEMNVYFDKMHQKNYQISIGSWSADIKDPMNFLEIFKSKNNGTNNTQWESKEFAALLDASMTIRDKMNRLVTLGKAERLLMEDVPVMPLFHTTFNYIKKKDVNGVYFSELGYLDLRHAYRGR